MEKLTQEELYKTKMEEAFSKMNLRADFIILEPFSLKKTELNSGIHIPESMVNNKVPHHLAKVAKVGNHVNKYLVGSALVDVEEECKIEVGDWIQVLTDRAPRTTVFGDEVYYVTDTSSVIGVLKKEVIEDLGINEDYLMSPTVIRGLINKIQENNYKKIAQKSNLTI